MKRLSFSLPTSASIALLALSLAFSAGCSNGNYASAVITQQTGDPAAILDFRDQMITIPEGSVASANIQLVAVDGDDMTGSLRSVDPSTLLVAQVAGTTNMWVFTGVAAGTTEVLVSANGQQALTIPATVTPAPSSDIGTTPTMEGTTTGPDGVPDASDEGDSGLGDGGANDATLEDSGPESGDAGSDDAGVDGARPGDAGGHDAKGAHD